MLGVTAAQNRGAAMTLAATVEFAVIMTRRGGEPDAADAARFEQVQALGRAERPQGVLTGGPGGHGLLFGLDTSRVPATRRPHRGSSSSPPPLAGCSISSALSAAAAAQWPDVPSARAIGPQPEGWHQDEVAAQQRRVALHLEPAATFRCHRNSARSGLRLTP